MESPQVTLLRVLSIFIFFYCCCGSVSAMDTYSPPPGFKDPLWSMSGMENLTMVNSGILNQVQAPGPESDVTPRMLVLAGNRTKRPDILHGFKRYKGGWNITNEHYWASVGFTGIAGFILAILWFFLFGAALVVYSCCRWRISMTGNKFRHSEKIRLGLLISFTCVSVVGCVVLSVGQDKFHSGVMHTLNYVVNQSDYTVHTLENVTEYLSLARTISVSQVFLPPEIGDEIDHLTMDLNSAAATLTTKTNENAVKIKRVFSSLRLALIVVASMMLVLAVLGLVLSLCGYQGAIHIFILSGWLLVAFTFILCGLFLIFNSAISDTCTAMQQWADNPQTETALSDILPCVNEQTTNKTLIESDKVVAGIVNMVNQFIYTYADTIRPPSDQFYYNQSGPLVPPLCYPFDGQMHDRECSQQEVSMVNASLVWQSYVCEADNGTCISSGRLTPDMYSQLVAAVNISYGIKHYTPPMLSLQNCNFVRETFVKITSSYCPLLERYLRLVNAGLGLISVGVMLCLIIWILYAKRPRRKEVSARFSWRSMLINCRHRLKVQAEGGHGLSKEEEIEATNSPLGGSLVPKV